MLLAMIVILLREGIAQQTMHKDVASTYFVEEKPSGSVIEKGDKPPGQKLEAPEEDT